MIIQCRRASDVVQEIFEENPGRAILLNVDTEGSEFAIFSSLGQIDLLKKVETIVLEYHNDPFPIIKILEEYGFRYGIIGEYRIGMLYAFNMSKNKNDAGSFGE